MSNSDQIQLSYIKESTYGQQVTGSNLTTVRLTSESLSESMTHQTSKEINPKRILKDIMRTNVSAGGDISFEMSYGVFDEFLKAVLMADSDWSTAFTETSSRISAVNNSGVMTITSPAVSQTFNSTSDVTVATDTVTWTAHGKASGFGPVQLTGTLPTGLATSTDYWIINAGTNAIKFATSRANALASTAVDITATQTGTATITASAGFASFPATGFCRISGFATAANNGVYAFTKSAGTLTIVGPTLVNESASPVVSVISGSMIKNGVTLASYNFERSYTDLVNTLALYTGMVFSQFSLNVQTGQQVTGSFTLIGQAEKSITASVGSGYTTPTAYNVMQPVDDVPFVFENSVDIDVTKFSLTLNNNPRVREVVGTLGPVSIGLGQISLNGTVSVYFTTSALMDKFINQTQSSLSIVLGSSSGGIYVIEIPYLKYTSGKRVAGGTNSDIIADLAWTAISNDGLTMIKIHRITLP